MRISQSQMGQFDMCPERLRWDIVNPMEDETDATAVGTATHHAIEHALRGEPDPLEYGIDKLYELMAQPHYRALKVKNHDTQVKYVRRCYQAWESQVRPHLGVTVDIERRLKHPMSDTIMAEGTPDLVDTDPNLYVSVHDWKTGRPPQEWEVARWNVQGRFYSWLVKVEHNLLYYPAFHLWYLPKANGEVTHMEMRGSDGWTAWLMEKAEQIEREIEQGTDRLWVRRDSGWWCSPDWCRKWDTCKGELV